MTKKSVVRCSVVQQAHWRPSYPHHDMTCQHEYPCSSQTSQDICLQMSQSPQFPSWTQIRWFFFVILNVLKMSYWVTLKQAVVYCKYIINSLSRLSLFSTAVLTIPFSPRSQTHPWCYWCFSSSCRWSPSAPSWLWRCRRLLRHRQHTFIMG